MGGGEAAGQQQKEVVRDGTRHIKRELLMGILIPFGIGWLFGATSIMVVAVIMIDRNGGDGDE